MSFSYALRPPSSPLSNIPNKMPQIETIKLNNTVASSTKWTISQNPALVSSLSNQYSFLTGHRELTNDFRVKHAQKLRKVREELWQVEEDPLECLIMVDAIQRLGIDYYFEEEIRSILHWQYLLSIAHTGLNNDLFEVSLRFRLMRQEGLHVASDVFKNFKDKEGKFKQNLGEDIRGWMELYEASQLSIEGEDILDEAGDYSSQLLRARLTHLDHNEAKAVINTLDNPHHKSLSKFMAQNFLKEWQATNGSMNALQELAIMDFKMDKLVHQNEIFQISKWWKDLGLAEELKFARDQPLKWYMWPMAFLSDPSLSAHRVELTKPISLIYIIDDIFDVYGTLDELTLFAAAVNRWDFSATKELPDCMKICFKALYDITSDISNKVYKEHGWNPIDSLRKTWATLCNAFLVEAEWFGCGQVPETEEYIRNGVVSSGVHVVLIHLFFLLGEGLNKESVDLVDSIPGIISSTAKILRLWDDLGSAKDEYQDGHDGSYVECYMKEHEGSSVEDARQHVIHMISVTWKQLNQECLSPNPFSPSFTRASLNVARMVRLMYNYDQNHCLPSLEEHVKALLNESVPF